MEKCSVERSNEKIKNSFGLRDKDVIMTMFVVACLIWGILFLLKAKQENITLRMQNAQKDKEILFYRKEIVNYKNSYEYHWINKYGDSLQFNYGN